MSYRLSVTRRLEWDAMHRISNHEGLCKAVHGHRYVAEITCSAPELDAVGRIVDFSVIKREIGGWIDANLDHTAILDTGDDHPVARAIAAANAEMGKPAYFMQGQPTAENIALELARKAQALMEPHGITVEHVRIWETPNCSASWTRG